MQCQEKMDRASAKLGRARSAINIAIKAGTEATVSELLDTLATVLDCIDGADSSMREGENQDAQPGQLAPVGSCTDRASSYARVVPLASATSAS